MADVDLSRVLRERGVATEVTLPIIENTKAQEAALLAVLGRVLTTWRAGLRERVLPTYRVALGPRIASQVDQALMEAYQDVERVIAGQIGNIEAWITDLERWHRRRIVANVQAVTRFDIAPFMERADVEPLLRAAVQRNVSLIRGLSDETRKRIEAATWNAYARGDSGAKLAKALREEMGFAPARARLIATDQLGKLSGDLDEARHLQMGVEEYDWTTAHDERVRESHAARDGKRYRWDAPGIKPGEEIRCRCKARAVVQVAEEENRRAA